MNEFGGGSDGGLTSILSMLAFLTMRGGVLRFAVNIPSSIPRLTRTTVLNKLCCSCCVCQSLTVSYVCLPN